VELLDTESTTDIGRYHTQFVLWDVQHEVAHQQLHDMRKLTCGPQRVLPARHIVFTDGRTWLHRIANQAIVDQADLCDMRRLLEGHIRGALVSQLPVAADVVGNIVEQRGSARLERIQHTDDCG